MKQKKAKQLTLLDVLPSAPGALDVTQTDNFPVAHLPEIHPGKMPSAQFVENIKRCGVLYPIVVLKTGTKLVVKDGLRRLTAARAAGLETIKVLLVDCSNVQGSVLGLALNEQRSENPIAELRLILELIRANADEKLVAAATGMPISRVRRRLRLTKLHPEWRELADRGAIKPSVAENLARMPATDQKRALRKFRKEKGRLRLTDLKKLRQAEAANAIASLSAELFQPEATAAAAAHSEVSALLAKAKGLLPAIHPAQRHLDQAISSLSGALDGVGTAA